MDLGTSGAKRGKKKRDTSLEGQVGKGILFIAHLFPSSSLFLSLEESRYSSHFSRMIEC